MNQLGDPLDSAFIALYTAYYDRQTLDWDAFVAAAHQFFDTNPESSAAHDAYFNNFTIIWKQCLNAGQFDDAEETWAQALGPALQWEEARPGQRLHKGTPYYFWGMTA